MDEEKTPIILDLKGISTQSNKFIELRAKLIDNPAEYKEQLKIWMQQDPKDFYLDYLADLRILIDNARLDGEVKPTTLLQMEKAFLDSWRELARLSFPSADARLKASKQPQTNSKKLEEIYGKDAAD